MEPDRQTYLEPSDTSITSNNGQLKAKWRFDTEKTPGSEKSPERCQRCRDVCRENGERKKGIEIDLLGYSGGVAGIFLRNH